MHDSASIIELDGRDGAFADFLEIPALVYGSDARWIPEESAELSHAFSKANPWLAMGQARLFCVPKKARAAGFLNPAVRVHGGPLACFGYWETRADPAEDRALFERLEAWARAGGATRIFGPCNFSTFGSYRLRLEAETDAAPFPGEPYNPPDYPSRLQALGFRLDERYVTFRFDDDAVATLAPKMDPVLTRLDRDGYRIERLPAPLWLSSLPEIHLMIDAIFADNLGYTPLPYAAFAEACGGKLARKACPEASAIAFGPKGDIAGFFLTFPDYGPLICQGAGASRLRLDEIDFARHYPLLRKLGPTRSLGKTVGVHPAHRQRGLMEVLVFRWLTWGRGLYDSFLGTLIRQDNWSRRAGAGCSRDIRSYGLFVKDL